MVAPSNKALDEIDGCTQKIVALMYNVLMIKDGCAQKIVARMYNVLDEKYGCTRKSCASVQCTRWTRWL